MLGTHVKSPDGQSGPYFFRFRFGLRAAGARLDLRAPRNFTKVLLALGALAIHRPGLETALFQPTLDLVFREADVRLNPCVRYESALHVAKNGLHANLKSLR
jgi:hypothetical protein